METIPKLTEQELQKHIDLTKIREGGNEYAYPLSIKNDSTLRSLFRRIAKGHLSTVSVTLTIDFYNEQIEQANVAIQMVELYSDMLNKC